MTDFDPNWLLSTTAQSAAALVAIVGGFLISRVIGLNTEREQLLRKYRELRRHAEVIGATYQDVHDERMSVSREWFRDHHVKTILESGSEVEPDVLLDWIPIGSSTEELAPYARNLVLRVQRARSAIQAKYGRGGVPVADAKALRRKGIEIPEGEEDLFEKVAEELRSKSGYIKPALAIRPVGENPQVRRQEERIARERELKSSLDLTEAEETLTLKELDRLRTPWGLKSGLAVLGYLLLVGVIVPVALLMQNPVSENQTTRTIVVVLFVSGLIALMAYIVIAVKKLSTLPLETD